ncbi:MAG: alanine:cation symporter family protein [Clostridium argentinense]|uniref:alanine/glycine:cation symporter family protein n=1 Tax=uncultured Clostridium sp. TaxID=59620 RepID=UPI001D54F5B4|nr:sodium:alanine symporter family protein [uncultured Clostridium sp.]MBS5824106.1 alanine:cation symporter family protein [Clostridium argentinense]MDU1350711.1 sodium:alanine symporter family protein [Clostridium argentinense]
MDYLIEIVKQINNVLLNYILLVLLCGTGIFFTFKLKFIQVRKFGEGFRRIFGGLNLKGKKADKDGMSSFQALSTAIAAQVGTGNLAGAATAIVSGGPGAIFWMWLSAFLGMATIYAEATLSQLFKTRVGGEVTGGPAYYIKNGLKNKTISKFLAGFFAISCILALGFMGNIVQSNSISQAFSNAFGLPTFIAGIIVALLGGFVFFGGMGRIASVTEKVVPIMAILYILASLIIIILNGNQILPALKSIVVGAFNPEAVAGGVMGITIRQSIRYGVARGLFSNEAGMGSTPHAHAVANVKHPGEQGSVAIISVFIDTFIILTLTALVILTSGVLGSGVTGIALTQKAFESTLGSHGQGFVAICLLFFAFSTIIGWYFFGESNIKYLFGNKGLTTYRILVMIFVFIGSLLKVDLVWELADTFNALMVIPNLIAVLALSGLVAKSMNDYEEFRGINIDKTKSLKN